MAIMVRQTEDQAMWQKKDKYIIWCITKIAQGASILIVMIMACITYEVISRYFFNHPTSWVWLVSRQLFGLFIMIAGSYTMVERCHIRIEMLYERFPSWMKSASDYLSFTAFLCFITALIWKGSEMGWAAFLTRECATGAFPIPLYPLKMFIPIGALLLLISGIAVFITRNQKRM